MRIRLFAAEVTVLEEETAFACALASVDERRREKVLRMRRAEDRRLSLCAGLLLREALRLCGAPEGLRIAEGEHGKPYFPDAPQWHFNLSHSGRYALCAVGDIKVGCDIEQIGTGGLALARRFFAPEETARLEADADPTAFTRLWTLKESYIKAIGAGLSCPLNSFSIRADAETACLEYPEEEWHLKSFNDLPGMVCSVCACVPVDGLRLEMPELRL